MNQKFLEKYKSDGQKLSETEAERLASELKKKLRKGDKPKNDIETIKAMMGGLADKRGLVRKTFSEGLSEIGETSLPYLITALLTNKNVIVRRAAAKTLKLIGDPSALPHLLEALINDSDPVVQCSAAGAMAVFGESAVEHLFKVIKNPNSSAMQSGLATWGLAFIGPQAESMIKESVRSNNSLIRCAAISALGSQINLLSDKELKLLLIDATNDTSSEVQNEAIRLIGKLKNKKWVVEILIQKLKSKNPEIRKIAAISLISSNDKTVLHELKNVANSEKNLSVLNTIKLAIKRISQAQIPITK